MPAEFTNYGERITLTKLQRGYEASIISPLRYSKGAREQAAKFLAEDPTADDRALWGQARKVRKAVEEHRRIYRRRRAPLMVVRRQFLKHFLKFRRQLSGRHGKRKASNA